jgi:hypothetical protein
VPPSIAALVPLSTVRTEVTPVTPLAPNLGASPSAAAPAAEAVATTSNPVVQGGGGSGGTTPPPADADVNERVRALIERLIRALPILPQALRGWLRGLGARPAANEGRPAAVPEAARPDPDEGDAEAPALDGAETAEESARVAPPQAEGVLAGLLALAGACTLGPGGSRGPSPDGRKKHPGTRNDRSRRSDHAG